MKESLSRQHNRSRHDDSLAVILHDLFHSSHIGSSKNAGTVSSRLERPNGLVSDPSYPLGSTLIDDFANMCYAKNNSVLCTPTLYFKPMGDFHPTNNNIIIFVTSLLKNTHHQLLDSRTSVRAILSLETTSLSKCQVRSRISLYRLRVMKERNALAQNRTFPATTCVHDFTERARGIMASDHVREICLAANLLKVLSSVINHRNHVTFWDDIESLAVQVSGRDRGVERLAGEHCIWSGESHCGNSRLGSRDYGKPATKTESRRTRVCVRD